MNLTVPEVEAPDGTMIFALTLIELAAEVVTEGALHSFVPGIEVIRVSSFAVETSTHDSVLISEELAEPRKEIDMFTASA